jgi:hypothetical protein
MVTMLNQLPELQDDDILPPEQNQKFQRFVRNYHQAPSEAGMSSGEMQNPMMNQNEQVYTPEPFYPQERHEINCRDIEDHVSNCPICTRYYNTNKNERIMCFSVIIFLLIFCLLLLKKVLNL